MTTLFNLAALLSTTSGAIDFWRGRSLLGTSPPPCTDPACNRSMTQV